MKNNNRFNGVHFLYTHMSNHKILMRFDYYFNELINDPNRFPVKPCDALGLVATVVFHKAKKGNTWYGGIDKDRESGNT